MRQTRQHYLVAIQGGNVIVASTIEGDIAIHRILNAARAQAARCGLKYRNARVERRLSKAEAARYSVSQHLDLTRTLDQHKLTQATLSA